MKQAKIIPAAGQRIDYLDGLRAFIVILVVLHHSLLAYGTLASSYWYVADNKTTMVFDAVILLNDIFMMPAMFFIAGFFVIRSLQKGAAAFLKKKATRILLPLLIGVFLLISPLITYMGHLAKGNYKLDFFSYYFTVYLPKEVEPHHLWFLSFLFLLFLFSALVFSIGKKYFPVTAGEKRTARKVVAVKAGPLFFMAFGLITALFYFLATVFVDDGYWFGLGGFFAVQVTRSVFYIAYFLLGAAAYKNEWLSGAGFYAKGFLYVCAAAALSVLTIVFRVLTGTLTDTLLKLVYALLHSFMCLAWLFSLLFIFYRIRSAAGKMPGPLTTHSYKIYIMHMVIVIALQLLLFGYEMPVYLKALAVFSAGLGVSLLISMVIGKAQSLFAAPAARGKNST